MTETTNHNSQARAAIIAEVMRDLDRIDGEIAELQEERTKIKNTRIKGDLGMKLADFAVLRRFRDLEDEERDRLFDTLREGFAALGIGGQHSFLGALDDKVVPMSEAAPATEFDARNLGDLAWQAGQPITDVPPSVSRYGKLRAAWEQGWNEAAEAANSPSPAPQEAAAE